MLWIIYPHNVLFIKWFEIQKAVLNLINGAPTRATDPTIQTLKYVVNSHPFLFHRQSGSGTLMDDCANSASATTCCHSLPLPLCHRVPQPPPRRPIVLYVTLCAFVPPTHRRDAAPVCVEDPDICVHMVRWSALASPYGRLRFRFWGGCITTLRITSFWRIKVNAKDYKDWIYKILWLNTRGICYWVL